MVGGSNVNGDTSANEGLGVISLPVVKRLSVADYFLYPGTEANPGLDVAFEPGLTLILGANGLGKTTLVTLIYRLLTGTQDIPNLGGSAALGGRSLETRTRSRQEQRTFAERVVDGATSATARLTMLLGGKEVSISRRLSDLRLETFEVDDQERLATEDTFQRDLVSLSGMASFGDWILALRHLVFYFEDRQALIWDATAQRQLLRLLFLPPEISSAWTKQEREVLELDSLVRNLTYGLNKETSRLAKATAAVSNADEVRQSLALLADLQATEVSHLDERNDELAILADRRANARLEALTADQARQTARKTVERLELEAIASAFPDSSATARYLLAQFMTGSICLTCGSAAPQFQAELETRLVHDECIVCGAAVQRLANERTLHPRVLARERKIAQALEAQASEALIARGTAEGEYNAALNQVSKLTASTSERALAIDELVRQLPPEERELHAQHDAMTAMRANVEVRREELLAKRSAFANFVAEVNDRIAQQRDAIKTAFDGYASGFLVEDCELAWQPRKSRVGETGEQVEFAAFELAMSGAGFESATRRSGPGQVSESQREFIDLSFRMALMEVAASGGSSLVIDAPESSLDAVFVRRAANVLTTFASKSDHRLVVTSNLVDGDLIPSLLRQSGVRSSRDERVVDLLALAAPTAATRKLAAEYREIRKTLFARARSRVP